MQIVRRHAPGRTGEGRSASQMWAFSSRVLSTPRTRCVLFRCMPPCSCRPCRLHSQISSTSWRCLFMVQMIVDCRCYASPAGTVARICKQQEHTLIGTQCLCSAHVSTLSEARSMHRRFGGSYWSSIRAANEAYLYFLPKCLAGGAAEPAICHQPALLLQMATSCWRQILLKEGCPLLPAPANKGCSSSRWTGAACCSMVSKARGTIGTAITSAPWDRRCMYSVDRSTEAC